jgi:ATP-dependent DNA helicase RecG
MADALLLTERVLNTIQLGESHFREFKSALEGPPTAKKPRLAKSICADIAEALVAFANADGGELLIGVEDNGDVSGLPHGEDEVDKMLKAAETHVHGSSKLPLTHGSRLALGEKYVLFFAVAKGSSEVYQLSDGRCVCRKDKATVPESPHRILFDRQEIRSREFDRQFVDGASVSDLDVDLVRGLASEYIKGLSVERYLQQLGVAEYGVTGLRLRMAALLLFARDIHRWHPRSQVRILKVAGTEIKSGEQYNVTSDEPVQGNVYDLIVQSWEKLRPFLAYKTEFGADARFEQKYLYPEGACREALVNAIAHRDYSIMNGVDVFVFDDRMEIKSPGALLSTITIEDLRKLEGAHESRNAIIARVLRENKFMRELGEGMKRMFELMERSDLEEPKLSVEGNSFSITLPHKSVFTAQQEQWLLMFQQFSLTGLQKRILLLGMNDREISPAEIYKAINTEDRNVYDSEVTGLRTKFLLNEIRTNPQATLFARRNKIAKPNVPRFRVQLPGLAAPSVAPPRPKPATPRKPASHCAFVTNLPSGTTATAIREIFGKCGAIHRVDLPTHYNSGAIKGFAFVWYHTAEAASEAIRTLDQYQLGGNQLVVRERLES